jgi:SpoVK/Ycf46/Vps4 family AAA+-type ATPase
MSRSPLAIASLDASCDALAARTEGWSRASLVGLWEAAAMQALRRALSEGGGESHISDVDVENAFAIVERERS